MRSDETGKEKRGAAPEPAEGAEPRLDEGSELDDDALEALAVAGGSVSNSSGGNCKHNWVYSHREKGWLWGYNDIYKCTKCPQTKKVWV